MATDKKIPKSAKFFNGGLAGVLAATCVQPLDLIKNRMQMSGIGGVRIEHKTTARVFMHVVRNEGVLALYNGLSAGVLRQVTYTTTRMGIFTMLLETFTVEGKPPNFAAKAAFGMIAGMVGAFVGTPADVALIRMTSDGRLPENERRKYKNVVDALIRMAREEGITTWWRGAVATMSRAMVVNAAQLGTYSQAKEWLLTFPEYFKDNIGTHTVASMMSALVTTVASMPVDIAKTRIQNMKIINGKPEYKGAIDVFVKIVQQEGIAALWKGFTPYLTKLGPQTVLLLIFLEQINAFYIQYIAEPDAKSDKK